jgi:prepilin-type N-terminal cleavage/methylation domain-containing protein
VTRPRYLASTDEGFTLAELAVVLVIVSLLIGGLLIPLSAQIDQRNYNETQQQIGEIREALIGFAVANGRLPRPATSATNGAERVDCGSDEALCTGFIPWSTLGVKKTDAWNKIIQYSVTPAYANLPFALNTIGSKKVQTRDGAGNATYLIGSAGACSASSPCAPAVIHSAGRNNWGFADDGTALPDESATNADEEANAGLGSFSPLPPVFFSRDRYTVPVGGEFDDIVVWIPPYLLFNRMVSAGKLP